MPKATGFAIIKTTPPGGKIDKYQFHDRANEVFAAWMSGATEDECSQYFGITLEDVNNDLLHVKIALPVRLIISYNNDRNRILIQRQSSEDYRKLISDSLKTPAATYLAAGVSPAGIGREFREATGLVQKAEPLINVQTINAGNQTTSKSPIQSAEDIVRLVLGQINEQETPTPPTKEEEGVIDAEFVDEDKVPEEDD
jgi:hypothetical protein